MKIIQIRVASLLIILSVYAAPILFSQNFSNGFNFVLPTTDSTTQKFLPNFPAKVIGEADRVSVTGDKFTVGNNPIRFWGVNIVAAAAFPDKTKAPIIAARMRKMGINLVRFHHLENNWTGDNGCIFIYANGTRQLNPTTLDRLDFFIGELKKNNIYVDMNLNVSRVFQTSDGVQGADSLPDFAKGVTLFDPYLEKLQLEYAQQLLGHINPYTNEPLATDPVLAMVEMNNENSLYGFWKADRLCTFAQGGTILFRQNQLLDSLFQNYLTQKYVTQAALNTAWQPAGLTTANPELLMNPDFETGTFNLPWEMETHAPSAAAVSISSSIFRSGKYAAQLDVTAYSGTDWHLQFKQTNFNFRKDTLYKVSFWVKAKSNTNFICGFMNNNAPYTWYYGKNFQATTDWKLYTFSIAIPENDSTMRLTIQPQGTTTFWFDDFSVKKNVPTGLNTGENLVNKNVQRILWSNKFDNSPNRVADMSAFYIGLQKNHIDLIRNYLRNTLNVRAGITGTNDLTGQEDVKAEDNADYIDDHAYWDHPQFPGVPFDASNWFDNNTSMLQSPNMDAVTNIFSGLAVSNKPLTISEYNHPAPNRFRTEMPATLLAYAALHGADALMFFEYNGVFDWETDVVNGFFDLYRDNSIIALFPSCALAFRQGLIKEDVNPIRLNFSEKDIYNLAFKEQYSWKSYSQHDRRWSLLRSIKTDSYSAAATTTSAPVFSAPADNIYKTVTNETVLDNIKGIITTGAPNFASATGFLQNSTNIVAGNMTVVQSNQFASVIWASLNTQPLTTSKLSLLTVSTKQQNTGTVWNGTTTVNNNWGTAPTQIQPAIVKLKLNIQADSIKIYPLSNIGKEDTSIKIIPTTAGSFDITLNQSKDKTLWYGVETFGNGNSATGIIPPAQNMPTLNKSYPNPVYDGSINLDYTVRENGVINIAIYDMSGKLIKSIFSGWQPVGQYALKVDIINISTGKYSIILNEENSGYQYSSFNTAYLPLIIIH